MDNGLSAQNWAMMFIEKYGEDFAVSVAKEIHMIVSTGATGPQAFAPQGDPEIARLFSLLPDTLEFSERNGRTFMVKPLTTFALAKYRRYYLAYMPEDGDGIFYVCRLYYHYPNGEKIPFERVSVDGEVTGTTQISYEAIGNPLEEDIATQMLHLTLTLGAAIQDDDAEKAEAVTNRIVELGSI